MTLRWPVAGGSVRAMVTEEWRAVPGYEDTYEVSDQGRVRSVDRTVITKAGYAQRHTGQMLTPRPDARGYGYRIVTLWRDGRGYAVGIHRLVLLAFVGPCPPGMQCRHLDGRHGNNVPSNLTWGTASENILDKVRHGTHWQASQEECPYGHPYDEANTKVYRGSRFCRRCTYERSQGRRGRVSRRKAAV